VFKVGADLSDLKKEMGKVEGIASKAGDVAGAALKAGFAASVGAAGAIGLFAKGVLEEGAQFENLSVRLTTLMGSATDARDRMQELANIGKTTPFELPGIVEAEASLRGFGVDAEAVLPKVMDLSAALGLDLSDAAMSVGKAMAGGAGAADVLRERGVLAAIELRTGIKATNMEIGQFREELMITLEEYEGGTAMLAATLDGQVSNLKDSWGDFQRQVADAGFYDASKAAIGELNRLLAENEETVSRIAQETSRWLKGSLLFAVKTVGDIAAGFLEMKLAITSIQGLMLALDVTTARWAVNIYEAAAALSEATNPLGIFDIRTRMLEERAAASRGRAAASLKQMNEMKKEAEDIKKDLAGVNADTEQILSAIEMASAGGSEEEKKKKGGAPEGQEDPEAKALKGRQDLISSILEQYREEEAEEAAEAWDNATKLREQQYADWAQAEQDAADERLRILEETQARRMEIAKQGADIALDLARAGGQAVADEDVSFGEMMKKQGLQLISDLLMQLAGYFAAKALAYAATGNIPKAALFGAGALVAAAGSGVVSVAASNIDTSQESEGETFTQGSRTEVGASSGGGDTDGGLAAAADALIGAADELKDAARAIARSATGSGGGSLARTLQRQRSISGLFSSFQGA
jgi:hypothetical protein